MRIEEFDELIGGDSYVRCRGKERIDRDVINVFKAKAHVNNGGQIGWWVRKGYIVVDIDEGKDKAKRVIKALGIDTLTAETPKGLHLYFETDTQYKQKVGMILPCGLKCDYRVAKKGYVILPYGTEGRKFNNSKQIAPLPLEFTAIQIKCESLYNLKEGDGRNAKLFTHLMAYKRSGASENQLRAMADIINKIVFEEPMSPEELEKILNNTQRYEVAGDNPFVLYNAKGVPAQINARAIVDYFKDSREVFVMGNEVYKYHKGVFRESSLEVQKIIQELVVAPHLITHARISDVFKLLLKEPELQQSSNSLDANKNLINFLNGVWNIQDKELLPHDKKYLQMIQIPHNYIPTNKVFEDTMLYDFLVGEVKLLPPELELLMSYMAYTLISDRGLKTFLTLVGPSNTGKSVLIRFMESLVGAKNVSSLSMHDLNRKFYPSQLYGKLLNSCADNSSLPLSSIDNIKKITGGDHIMHEKKGKDPFFFVSFAKLVFSFNQLPLQLEEKSDAFYERMRILAMPYALRLNNDYVNKLCSSKNIESVLPHILSFLPLKTMPNPKSSKALVDMLRQDSDSIHAYVKQKCVVANNFIVVKRVMYESYVNYCLATGRQPEKYHDFNRYMKTTYREARHPKSGEAIWKGIGMERGNIQ